MKVLVSGSSGFIGSRLVERLKENGDEVDGFDSVMGQDLRDLGQVILAVEGHDMVFHLAAIADLNWARVHPLETMDINVQGTWNMAYACQKAGAKLFFASTCCVFGAQTHHPTTELDLPNPNEIYACSKLAGESVIKGFNKTYGLGYNFMRFATIYGEGTRPALATHIFLGQALRGEPITVHGDGSQTRTLTHVDDLIDSIMALYKSKKVNDVWNLTATQEISAMQMARDIKTITGSKSIIVNVPQRIGQTFKEVISADKMKNEIGWQAKVKWLDGINRMYKWFVATDQIKNIYHEPQFAVTNGVKKVKAKV